MKRILGLPLLMNLLVPLPVRAQLSSPDFRSYLFAQNFAQNLLPVPYPPSGGQTTFLPPPPGSNWDAAALVVPERCSQAGTQVVRVEGGYLCLPQTAVAAPQLPSALRSPTGCRAFSGTRMVRLAGGYVCLPR